MAAIGRAQALDPSSTKRVLDRAWILLLMGRPDEAVTLTRQAHVMDPETTGANDAPYFSWVECQANLMSGNYQEATPHCEQNGANGDSWRDQVLLIAAYAQQGEMAKAAAAKTVALRLKPTLSIGRLKTMPQVGSAAYLDLLETHYYSGLRKAAFPEQ